MPAYLLIFGINVAYPFGAFKSSLIKNIPRFHLEAPSPHARVGVRGMQIGSLEILGFDHPPPLTSPVEGRGKTEVADENYFVYLWNRSSGSRRRKWRNSPALVMESKKYWREIPIRHSL
jgi:hypothetical protein